MNDQALRQLLLNADATAGAVPATSDDLASAVRTRLRRRRQSQAAALSIVLCVLLAALPFLGTKSSPRPLVKVDQTGKELSMIRLQADSQAAAVNRLMQYQRLVDVRTTAERKLDRGQVLDRLQQQRENAARLLTHDGEYRRVLELFPETHWASVARQRLHT